MRTCNEDKPCHRWKLGPWGRVSIILSTCSIVPSRCSIVLCQCSVVVVIKCCCSIHMFHSCVQMLNGSVEVFYCSVQVNVQM